MEAGDGGESGDQVGEQAIDFCKTRIGVAGSQDCGEDQDDLEKSGGFA